MKISKIIMLIICYTIPLVVFFHFPEEFKIYFMYLHFIIYIVINDSSENNLKERIEDLENIINKNNYDR